MDHNNSRSNDDRQKRSKHQPIQPPSPTPASRASQHKKADANATAAARHEKRVSVFGRLGMPRDSGSSQSQPRPQTSWKPRQNTHHNPNRPGWIDYSNPNRKPQPIRPGLQQQRSSGGNFRDRNIEGRRRETTTFRRSPKPRPPVNKNPASPTVREKRHRTVTTTSRNSNPKSPPRSYAAFNESVSSNENNLPKVTTLQPSTKRKRHDSTSSASDLNTSTKIAVRSTVVVSQKKPNDDQKKPKSRKLEVQGLQQQQQSTVINDDSTFFDKDSAHELERKRQMLKKRIQQLDSSAEFVNEPEAIVSKSKPAKSTSESKSTRRTVPETAATVRQVSSRRHSNSRDENPDRSTIVNRRDASYSNPRNQKFAPVRRSTSRDPPSSTVTGHRGQKRSHDEMQRPSHISRRVQDVGLYNTRDKSPLRNNRPYQQRPMMNFRQQQYHQTFRRNDPYDKRPPVNNRFDNNTFNRHGPHQNNSRPPRPATVIQNQNSRPMMHANNNTRDRATLQQQQQQRHRVQQLRHSRTGVTTNLARNRFVQRPTVIPRSDTRNSRPTVRRTVTSTTYIRKTKIDTTSTKTGPKRSTSSDVKESKRKRATLEDTAASTKKEKSSTFVSKSTEKDSSKTKVDNTDLHKPSSSQRSDIKKLDKPKRSRSTSQEKLTPLSTTTKTTVARPVNVNIETRLAENDDADNYNQDTVGTVTQLGITVAETMADLSTIEQELEPISDDDDEMPSSVTNNDQETDNNRIDWTLLEKEPEETGSVNSEKRNPLEQFTLENFLPTLQFESSLLDPELMYQIGTIVQKKNTKPIEKANFGTGNALCARYDLNLRRRLCGLHSEPPAHVTLNTSELGLPYNEEAYNMAVNIYRKNMVMRKSIVNT